MFFNLLDAQLKTGIYRNDTNQVLPHSALGYLAVAEVARMKAGSVMVPRVTNWGLPTTYMQYLAIAADSH